MIRCHRALLSALAAAALAAPVVTVAVAAPKKPAKPAKPAKPKGDAKAGKTAFSNEGCAGCHKTKDFPKAGEAGPDLSHIGKDHKYDQIVAYIKKPKAGSIMPAFKVTNAKDQKTLDNLGAYLLAQK